MGYTSDVLPSVGEVSGRKERYIAAGFDGHGMLVIYLTMKGIAEMVLKEKGLEEVGIPIVYKTTRERLESEVDLLKPKDWEEGKEGDLEVPKMSLKQDMRRCFGVLCRLFMHYL
jgi:hypothetical protein